MFSRFLEFLFSLQHVRITPGTRFSFVWNHPVLIILGAIVLAVIGYTFYFRQAASPAKRRAMGIVRALLLIVVFLLCWRPQLVMEHEERTRSLVAVWVDNSASMSLEDPYTGGTGREAGAMREYLRRVAAAPASSSQPAGEAPTASLRPNRFRLATAALSDSAWLRELVDTQDIAFFTGSAHAQPLGTARSKDQVDAFVATLRKEQPTGVSTDVPTVLREIMEKTQGQRLSALVMLTDGQTTERGSRLDAAAALARQADAKVFPVPVGQENEPFDLKLATLRLPPSTFIKDPVAAKVHIASAGVTVPTAVRINIFRKQGGAGGGDAALGTPIATKDVTLDPTKRELDAEVPLTLEKKDSNARSERFDLVAKIEPANGAGGGGTGGAEELTLNNNTAAGSVTVLDAQINVLYVEGSPRWEFRYLKNELIREPTVNLSTLLVSADEDFTQDADPPVRDKQTGEEIFPGALRHFPDSPTDLNKYDVLLLGDVEPTFFSPSQQRLIVDWVKTRGGGMLWMAGPNFNPEHYRQTALEILLPITPDEIDPRARVTSPPDNTPFTLALTPAGRDTNLFRFFPDPDLSWKQVNDLPEMFWFKPIQGLKPGSIVLAMHPKRSQAGNPAPLLVVRQFGAGPVLFSAYADTWRWRRYTGEPLFQSYWLQLCRLLYANKALGQSKRLELAAETARVEVGKPLKVTLAVKDPTLAGQVPTEVPVSLVDKDGQSAATITLTHTARAATTQPAAGGAAGGGTGSVETLEGTALVNRLGDFTLAVRPGLLPVELAPINVTVEQPQLEFETVTTDIPSLKSLATKTTGAVVPPYRTAELPRQIPDRAVPALVAQSEELWNKPFALVLVVLLATIEWLLRKNAGLI
jgi:hypothetical protein